MRGKYAGIGAGRLIRFAQLPGTDPRGAIGQYVNFIHPTLTAPIGAK